MTSNARVRCSWLACSGVRLLFSKSQAHTLDARSMWRPPHADGASSRSNCGPRLNSSRNHENTIPSCRGNGVGHRADRSTTVSQGRGVGWLTNGDASNNGTLPSVFDTGNTIGAALRETRPNTTVVDAAFTRLFPHIGVPQKSKWVGLTTMTSLNDLRAGGAGPAVVIR